MRKIFTSYTECFISIAFALNWCTTMDGFGLQHGCKEATNPSIYPTLSKIGGGNFSAPLKPFSCIIAGGGFFVLFDSMNYSENLFIYLFNE